MYKEIRDKLCGSSFRLATKEEAKESKLAHENDRCDAGFCTGVFVDNASYAYDIRSCAICGKVIGFI